MWGDGYDLICVTSSWEGAVDASEDGSVGWCFEDPV